MREKEKNSYNVALPKLLLGFVTSGFMKRDWGWEVEKRWRGQRCEGREVEHGNIYIFLIFFFEKRVA